MSEIYWISRLDYICNLFIALSIIFGTIVAVGGFTLVVSDRSDNDYPTMLKIVKRSTLILGFSLLGVIFLPNTKQAYMIWGLGGTIDYIKSNETVQKLPDKTIQCLDKFLDKYLNEEDSTHNR
jgi:hypothetical protein|nr:MAG TPA: hypothetical protein [Crassvirales sp.]